ncbi:hypothetical protein [Pectobacterium betavasculorum]|uniref:Uncharacterized protein n=1 Tax=Pectobacterium betavasculorum TaxID=55207 RepID=A0ABR4UU06_9GAMM|nr:hypothetical protein [Pectobacterium betavasculorum]KFX11373.1 hypothetical protein JV35_20975 [Pectobacterium betavasculorum]
MIYSFIARKYVNKPVLSNMKFNDLFYFDGKCNIDYKIKGNYNTLLEYFIEKTKCDITGYLDKYDDCLELLSKTDPRCYIRGKYHMEMFCSFLLSLQQAIGDKLPYKQKFQINDESLFLFAGPRIAIPDSIVDFISDALPDFID